MQNFVREMQIYNIKLIPSISCKWSNLQIHRKPNFSCLQLQYFNIAKHEGFYLKNLSSTLPKPSLNALPSAKSISFIKNCPSNERLQSASTATTWMDQSSISKTNTECSKRIINISCIAYRSLKLSSTETKSCQLDAQLIWNIAILNKFPIYQRKKCIIKATMWSRAVYIMIEVHLMKREQKSFRAGKAASTYPFQSTFQLCVRVLSGFFIPSVFFSHFFS